MFVQTREEMAPLYTKLNHLISQVYPDYSPDSDVMRGSVVKLTIGDYIYRMPGFLENVNVTIDNSNTPWEIQLLGQNVESDVAQLPHLVTISCTFKPIFDILPQRVTKSKPYVPLIANTDRNILLNYIDDKTPAPQITITQTSEPNVVDEAGRMSAGEAGANSPNGNKTQILTNKAKKQVQANQNLKAKEAAKAVQRRSPRFGPVAPANQNQLPLFGR